MKKTILLGAIAVLLAHSAGATLSWSNPLTLNSPNIVGIAAGTTGNGQGSWTYEQQVAQALLDMTKNQTATPTIGNAATLLTTSSTEYSGTVIGNNISQGGAGQPIGSGWDYVIAKYGGKDAGYVLFYLDGQAADLPQYPSDFWTTSDQYGISGWTAFDVTPPAVPEPTTVIAGALLLLPLGVSAIRILHKSRTA